MAIVITGSPGVGKHTLARRITTSEKMELLDINTVALQKLDYRPKKNIQKENYYIKINTKSERIYQESIDIDTTKLKRKLGKIIHKDSLVVGHLGPYVVPKDKADVVIVLRKNPYKLQRIYTKRNYDAKKSLDNLASEILGIIYYDCIKSFGLKKTYCVDLSTRTIKESADILRQIIANNSPSNKRRKKEFAGDTVDWLGMVEKRGDLARFFPS